MNEPRKISLVIASVLKPVDDTRNFEKLGCTLAKHSRFEVHMVGSGKIPTAPSPVCFHTLGTFGRLSWSRFIASFKVLNIVRRLRPDLFVTTTHELLWVAAYAKIFLGARTVYDIQENYYLNIRHTNSFPLILRWSLAAFVRAKEIISSSFFDLFICAERIYVDQLKFANRKYAVIENKAVLPAGLSRTPGPGIVLLFSGTLAESTGVFDAIRLSTMLHEKDQRIRLHIIGYCPKSATHTRLLNEIRDKPFIVLTGGNEIQPHNAIMQAIAASNFGIVNYPQSPHTAGAFPTKAYEYLACSLPVLYTREWASLFKPYNAGVLVDKNVPADEILIRMTHQQPYSVKTDDVLWESEEPRLTDAILQLLAGRV